MQAHGDPALTAQTILELDTQAIGRLRDLLLEERAALGTRDAGRLDGTVQNKIECLRQLERNEQERRQLLHRCGTADWSGLLSSLDPTLGAGWERLRGRLREVAELTEINEKIVNRTRYSTTRLLALLRGRIEEPDGVYDRSGRTAGYGDNRPIASA
jgi:flagellar biosynthesis/type III secretory pathway chaperone